MLPLLATATAGLSVLPWCIQGLKLEPVSPKDFPTPYTQPYSLPEEWILDASFEARKKSSKKGFDLWVANGDRNPPGDFDGMRIAFGQAFIEMFMNDRTPQKLNPVASCPWEFASPHRIKLEQHSGDLKLSTQERGGPWQECFKIEDVALPAGYSVNLDGQVPPINSLDVWHVTRELPPHQEQHASGSASSESQEALLASLQQLSHKFDSASSSGGNTAALEARLASIENRLASIDAAKGTEVRELTFVKDKLDSLQNKLNPLTGLQNRVSDVFSLLHRTSTQLNDDRVYRDLMLSQGMSWWKVLLLLLSVPLLLFILWKVVTSVSPERRGKKMI